MTATSQSNSVSPFETWRSKGRAFLAARNGTGWFICDNVGTYYGSWQDIANFRERYSNNDPCLSLGAGAVVSVRGTP